MTSTEEAAREALDKLHRYSFGHVGEIERTDIAGLVTIISDALPSRAVVESPTDEDGDLPKVIEAAVRAITPMVTNETHAWNLWNFLNTSEAFETAFLRFHPRRVSVPPTEDWEYGVRHVDVDGHPHLTRHPSRDLAELDFDTCGLNCEMVRRSLDADDTPWLPVPTEEKS